MERCIILDRMAAGKSLAAGPVETQVVEKTAQDAAAGSRRSRCGCRVEFALAFDATSVWFDAGGCVPNGTPGSSSGGTFTLGSARIGAVASGSFGVSEDSLRVVRAPCTPG